MKPGFKEPKIIVPLCIAVLFFLTIYINDSPNNLKVIFYPIFREIKKESFIIENRNQHIIESDNVKIYYVDTSPLCLKMIEENCEKSIKQVLKDFGYNPGSKIIIIIYPEYEEMADRIGLGTGSAAMGVYYGGVISILEPAKWIGSSYNMVEIFNREGPILHEFTHYILDYMTGGNIPVWFTEGVALYEEYKVNGVIWAQNKLYNDYYTVEELEKNFYSLDETKSYKESFLIVKYIEERFGMNCIKDIAKELRNGNSIDEALQKTINMDEYQVFKESLPGDQ
jgi:hypothetical protein